jgi:protein required for attachment to host cells
LRSTCPLHDWSIDMEKTWILVADAHRARCFERNGRHEAPTELADFVYPQDRIPHGQTDPALRASAGKGHGRSAHSGTQFEPKTDLHGKERASFAHELTQYLNRGVAEQRCKALVLIASSPMLGQLKPGLSPAASQLLHRCVAADLTHYQGPELARRIDQALSLPDGAGA